MHFPWNFWSPQTRRHTNAVYKRIHIIRSRHDGVRSCQNKSAVWRMKNGPVAS